MTTMVTIAVFIQPGTFIKMTGLKLIRIRKRNADLSPHIIVIRRNFDACTDIADDKNCQNKPSHNLTILLKPVSKGKHGPLSGSSADQPSGLDGPYGTPAMHAGGLVLRPRLSDHHPCSSGQPVRVCGTAMIRHLDSEFRESLMSKYKFYWADTAALGLLLILLASKSMAGGTIETPPDDEASSDSRVEIIVTPAERNQILEEMRGLLEAVQTVIVANNAGDLDTVAVAGRKVGRANMTPHSAEFKDKLPMDFRKLGMDTHLRFDKLALGAEQSESTDQLSQQLGELMGNCVACHKTYRLTVQRQPL
jgi:hypothetical protein